MPSLRIRVTDGARSGFLRLPNISVGQAAKQRLVELLDNGRRRSRSTAPTCRSA